MTDLLNFSIGEFNCNIADAQYIMSLSSRGGDSSTHTWFY